MRDALGQARGVRRGAGARGAERVVLHARALHVRLGLSCCCGSLPAAACRYLYPYLPACLSA